MFRISRYDAVISVAKRKKVYYKNLSSDDKAKFKDIYSDLIYERFLCIYDCKCKDQSLRDELYNNISKRFVENEFVDFKFIRVLEFHKSGQPHYHFLSNRYVPHTLLKKLTVEGVSEVYDNTYIVEDALRKNPDLTYDSVDTDIVSNYVSKITNYVTKDTIDTFLTMQGDGDISKKAY